MKADHGSLAVIYSFGWAVRYFSGTTQQPLLLQTEAGDIEFGSDDDPITIEISRFDFIRAATGRRSAQQISSYVSSHAIDPQLVLGASIFTLSTFDVVE